MTAGAVAVENGARVVDDVVALAQSLGLDVRPQFKLGRRVWGAARQIDLLLTHPTTRERFGIECKFQGTRGSAEEKLFATLLDIDMWPIRGLIVLGGEGFSEAMRNYLIGTGKAVSFDDLDMRLRLFFKFNFPEKT